MKVRNCTFVPGMSIAAQNRLLIADLAVMRIDKETKAETRWFSEESQYYLAELTEYLKN